MLVIKGHTLVPILNPCVALLGAYLKKRSAETRLFCLNLYTGGLEWLKAITAYLIISLVELNVRTREFVHALLNPSARSHKNFLTNGYVIAIIRGIKPLCAWLDRFSLAYQRINVLWTLCVWFVTVENNSMDILHKKDCFKEGYHFLTIAYLIYP